MMQSIAISAYLGRSENCPLPNASSLIYNLSYYRYYDTLLMLTLQHFSVTKLTFHFIKLLQAFSVSKLTFYFIKLSCLLWY